MSNSVVNIGDMSVKVVNDGEFTQAGCTISAHDMEMDKRAVAAVHSAIERAEICHKPIARYDVKNKQAYLEYADGRREYVG